MARATRSSTKASQDEPKAASPPSSTTSTNGISRKRKANSKDNTPQKAKRGIARPKKVQKTLEETMPDAEDDDADDVDDTNDVNEIDDQDMKDAADEVEKNEEEKNDEVDGDEEENDDKMEVDKGDEGAEKTIEKTENGVEHKEAEVAVDEDTEEKSGEHTKTADTTGENVSASKGKGDDESAEAKKSDAATSKQDDAEAKVNKSKDNATETTSNETNAVESSQSRSAAMPSSTHEKGLIYFFIRPRVSTDQAHASGVEDIARSYIVLRPLPLGSKLTQGQIPDLGTARLLALPKKVLPRSPKDRFLTFVEAAKSSVADLKDGFMTPGDTGARATNPVTLVGEGVYSISTVGRDTRLAYLLTVPSELGEVQKSVGLADKGAFILSVKNPTASGPANASLDKGAEYSQEIMDEFGSLRWMPCLPKHLDYINSQVLLIGEGHGHIGKAGEEGENGEGNAGEELEKLEEEDAARVEALKGDEADAIFADLGADSKDFPGVATTW